MSFDGLSFSGVGTPVESKIPLAEGKKMSLENCPFCNGEIEMQDMEQMPCPVCRSCGCIFEFYKEDYTEEEVEKLFNRRDGQPTVHNCPNCKCVPEPENLPRIQENENGKH